ncbi:MAG: MBL fold metallo-hydrolase [Myxococcota bacterium]|nr:MBL fold metallo-hydrolase [Myxococcota bacterium]
MKSPTIRSEPGLLVCSLASGSRGNSTYVGTLECGLLVDVGISAKRAAELLRRRDLDPDAVSGILVTHEHRDHSAGVRVFCRRHRVPVYVQHDVRPEVDLRGVDDVRTFAGDAPFDVAGFRVDPFPIPHDTVEPLGYVIERDGCRVGVATDMGMRTRLAEERLSACGAVLLEFNHDLEMLIEGPYPWWLKQRVKGRLGHLSNDDALEMLEVLVGGSVRTVMLGHLSQENNRPELVEAMVRDRLASLDRPDVDVTVLEQDRPGPVIGVSRSETVPVCRTTETESESESETESETESESESESESRSEPQTALFVGGKA